MKNAPHVELPALNDNGLTFQMLEKRIMMSVALFGSFTFGFIFFGQTPTILGLMVFLGPIDAFNIAPKLFGLLGLIIMGLSFKWRGTSHWHLIALLGTTALFSSWVLFFKLVDGNLISFLGTFPFLFFVTWFLAHSLKELHLIRRLNERFQGEPNPATSNGKVVFSGVFSFIIDPIRSWLRGDDLKEQG